MEKINIAELLKNCPKGMELDCTMYDKVILLHVDDKADIVFPIRVVREDGNSIALTKYGQCTDADFAKCVIFPKGKTTWEGFHRSFKDGDILVGKANQPFIFQSFNDDNGCSSYCGIRSNGEFCLHSNDWTFANSLRFATEEEKCKLFKAIKDNGFKWNSETKTLEKLIESKFKVGDKIVNVLRKHMGASGTQGVISKITDDKYIFTDGSYMPIGSQDNWELVPNKFDISTLVPFESRVLVRDYDNGIWKVSFWGCVMDSEYAFKYDTTRGCYKQCIPYEGNEHLLGKTDDCDDFYKIWE